MRRLIMFVLTLTICLPGYAARRAEPTPPQVKRRTPVAKPRTVAPDLIPGECFGNVCAACAEVTYSDGSSSIECRWNDVYGGCGCRISVRNGTCTESGVCHFQP